MGEMRNAYKFQSEKPVGKGKVWHVHVNDRIILNRSYRKGVRGNGVDSTGSEEDPVTSCYEHGNEPSASTKDEEFAG
jgi:hypothetical protein